MGILGLLKQPFQTLHLPPPNSFQSQTVLITGANTGLGLETARHMVTLGAAKVILGVRTLSKGLTAKADIEATTGKPNVVEVWELDLASFDSVKRFAEKAKRLPRLDAAVMNAGLASGSWNITSDGWERGLQVNVLSTTLLSLLLLPLLVKTGKTFSGARPHLTIVASDMADTVAFKERGEANILEALNNEKRWEAGQKIALTERYSVTKLFNLYMLESIAHLFGKDPTVVVNSLTPGFCKSELMSREPGVPAALKIIQALVGRTTAEGSKTLVHAVFQGKETHGKFLENQKIRDSGILVTSKEGQLLRAKIWSEILEVLKTVAPETKEIAKV